MTQLTHLTATLDTDAQLHHWLLKHGFHVEPDTNTAGLRRYVHRISYHAAHVVPYKGQLHVTVRGISSTFKYSVVTDADRRCEPPPRTSTRGRKPKPLFYKLIEKIVVVGYPNWNWEIPKYAQVPPEQWPDPLHQPWNWKGSQVGGTNRMRRIRQGPTTYAYTIHDKKYPTVAHQGKQYSPLRLMYELMIEDIPPGKKLRAKGRTQGYPMNVNPSHYEPTYPGNRNLWNFTLMDFEPDTETPEAKTEQEANYSMSTQDIADFADLVEERMAQQRIPTYQDFLNEFEMDLFDATEDDIRAILKTAGLLERYGFNG